MDTEAAMYQVHGVLPTADSVAGGLTGHVSVALPVH